MIIQLNKVRNNDGLNVRTILKQNIATVKSLSLSSQMCTSEYLELCDDAHRCLALYNSATTCLNSKQENCDTIKSGGAARDRDTDGDRAMDRDRDRDRNRNWERDGRTDEHSPHEDITTALSWSPKAVLRKNGSYIKICSPLSH